MFTLNGISQTILFQIWESILLEFTLQTDTYKYPGNTTGTG